MADIKTTLELDVSGFLTPLQKASTALGEFLGQSTQQKIANLKNSFKDLQSELDKTKTKLEGISGVIAGAGFGAFIKSVMDAGSEAVMAGEKFSITTQKMMEINAAASAVGIGGEKVSTMMNKMLVSAEQARDGNLKLRDALNQLGTSTEYLRTHDASETFQKQVDALAAMEDPAKRASLAQEVLGRGARSTDWKALSESLHKYNDTMGAYAEAAEDARATSLAINTYITNLKLTFLQIIQPLEGFIQRILDTKFAINAAIAVIAGLGIITAVIGLFKAWEMAVAALNIITKALNATLSIMNALLSPEVAIIAAVVAGLLAMYVAYEVVTGKVDSFSDGIKKLSSDLSGFGSEAWKKVTDMVGLNTKALELNKQASDKLSSGAPVLSGGDRDMNAKELANLKKMFDQMMLNNQLSLEKLQNELKFVNASDAVRAAEAQRFEAEARYKKQIQQIDEEIAVLQAKQKQTRGANYGPDIAYLEEAKKKIQDQSTEEAKLKGLISEGTFLRNERLELDKQLETLANQRLTLEEAYNDYSKTEDQRKLDALDTQMRKEKEAIRARFAKDQGTDDQSQWDTKAVEAFNQSIGKVNSSMAEYKAQAQKNIDQSRDFGANWDKALNQYVSDATNAGKIADNAFKSLSGNIENYLESMVTHGKFSFSDLTNAVITDIIKMEIKAATSSLFSSFGTATGGGSGLMASLMGFFSGPGKASGGYIPPNGFSLVGENGPELIKGPATVTNAANTESMLGGQNVTHNYNINAIDSKSMAQMFSENRMTMFAYTEQARRELPMRTR